MPYIIHVYKYITNVIIFRIILPTITYLTKLTFVTPQIFSKFTSNTFNSSHSNSFIFDSVGRICFSGSQVILKEQNFGRKGPNIILQ